MTRTASNGYYRMLRFFIRRTGILWVIFITVAYGQFSPGVLSAPHAFLDGNQFCKDCHSKGKIVDHEDCLNCHTTLKDRISAGRGFHGNQKTDDCIRCHSEHNGRIFKMIYWPDGMGEFDHEKTGYSLKGKHRELKCRKCHNAKLIADENVLSWEKDIRRDVFADSTFLGLPVDCKGCHEDVHSKEISHSDTSLFTKKSCEQCHDQQDWKKARKDFDHSQTKFQLKDAHVSVECRKCHPAAGESEKTDLAFRAKNGDRCINCHEDIHKGSFGEDCTTCHSGKSWKERKNFNHGNTKFPLIGKHTNLDCKKCHKFGETIREFQRCRDCHEDIHRGQFFTEKRWHDCSQCHREKGWLPALFTIDDHGKTSFPLQENHLAVPCFLCHLQETDPDGKYVKFTGIGTRCAQCHEDIHAGQFQAAIEKDDCTACHRTDQWKISQFDHSKTRFPLDGKHIQVKCEKCHQKENIIFENKTVRVIRYKPLKFACLDCHLETFEKQ